MKEEYVLKNILSNRLGSFEYKTQLKEEIACEKLAFAGMGIIMYGMSIYKTDGWSLLGSGINISFRLIKKLLTYLKISLLML